MPHTEQVIELNMQVTTTDEATAAKVVEILARAALGISAEESAHVSTDVERYQRMCHHPEHDEVEP